MRDLVLVPTYRRPEYLYLCLEHLAKAEGGTDKEIIIGIDRRPNDPPQALKETHDAIEMHRSRFAAVTVIERHQHQFVGNAFNFLELYREAYQSRAERVYLVEDDVLVGADFFRWHEAVQARGDYFCSVAWHCIRNPEVIRWADPTGYIESSRDFSSIGVCWKREKLAAVVHHARHDYYRDLSGYMRRTFPGSAVPYLTWTEQAGLILRILLADRGAVVAWPTLPRCAHIGISGYHRSTGHKFGGDLITRVSQLRVAIQSTESLIGMSRDPFDDVAALPPAKPWTAEQLDMVQRITGKHA